MTASKILSAVSRQRLGRLSGRFSAAFVWGAAGVVAGRGIQFLSTLILARLLAPGDFGAIAVALVVQSVALNVTDLGATAAIGRGGKDSSALAPTVLTISSITGFVLTGLIAAGSPFLSVALGNPDAAPVMQVMSLTILLAGVSGVPAAMVWRDYRQGSKAAVECVGAACTLILAVVMAVAGWGAMALAWSRVGGQLATTLGYWIVAPARVWPSFNGGHARGVLKLGIPLAGANLVVFLALNADYAVVGRVLGPQMLGFYLLAFTLSSVPGSLVTAAVRSVVVPSFGRLQARGSLREATPPLLDLVASVALPMAGIVTSLSALLVHVLYGPAWAPSIAPLIGLGIFAGGRVVTDFLADVCVGAGQTVALLWIQVAWLVVALPGIWFGATTFGLMGVGIAQAVVVWLVAVPACLVIAGRHTGVRGGRLAIGLLRPLAVGLAAGLLAFVVSSWSTSQILALLVGGVTGAAVASLLLFRHSSSSWRQFRTSLDTADLDLGREHV